jgi:hypothetical protein
MPVDLTVLQSYLDPKMLVVIVVLWVIGSLLKLSPIVADKWIIWVLTAVSLAAALLIFGLNIQGFIQGIVAVGVSVYGNQIVKQSSK